MKFTLNEKFILEERFILDEATLPEYRKKEAELIKAVENKKAELNEVLKNLESVILGDAKDGDGAAAAQKRLDKYEKPCGELVAKIDAFLQDFANKNIEISSKEDAEEVDGFIELAEENVFPGGSAKAAEDAPDTDDNILKAAENVNKLINQLQKLATGLSVIGRKAGGDAISAPSSVFSSD